MSYVSIILKNPFLKSSKQEDQYSYPKDQPHAQKGRLHRQSLVSGIYILRDNLKIRHKHRILILLLDDYDCR